MKYFIVSDKQKIVLCNNDGDGFKTEEDAIKNADMCKRECPDDNFTVVRGDHPAVQSMYSAGTITGTA